MATEATYRDSIFDSDIQCCAVDLQHCMPLTLLDTISECTRHIGLIGTMSTTFTETYSLAQQFASLDISSGRMA